MIIKDFDEKFYPMFDDTNARGYTLYSEGVQIDDCDIPKYIQTYFGNSNSEFIKALNDEYRRYCRFTYQRVRYDAFPEMMKRFLERKYDYIFLPAVQKMDTKELFEMFDGADTEFLFFVAVHIFAYHDEELRRAYNEDREKCSGRTEQEN